MRLPGKSLGESTLAEFIRGRPLRSRLFERYGLNTCTGGSLSLEEACRRARIEPQQLESRCAELDQPYAASLRFMNFSPGELAQDLLQTHHSYLAEELAALEILLERVANRYWRAVPAWPRVLLGFRELRAALEEHLAAEVELLLGPIVVEGCRLRDRLPAPGLCSLIGSFEAQHEQLRLQLRELRSLLGGYCIPRQACLGQQAAVARLRDLEHRTLLQIHKEDHVLFDQLRSGLTAG